MRFVSVSDFGWKKEKRKKNAASDYVLNSDISSF